MNYHKLIALQKANGYTDLQNRINDGSIWKFEGSVGSNAMQALESGECMLPKKFTFDYYGNKLPSRDVLQKGSKGTFQNAVNFWTKVENGEIDLYPECDEY